jgi:hypothetical protein
MTYTQQNKRRHARLEIHSRTFILLLVPMAGLCGGTKPCFSFALTVALPWSLIAFLLSLLSFSSLSASLEVLV